MTTVLIHPSRGAKDGRENLKRTLDVKVPFRKEPYASALTTRQHAELEARHPDGLAHFWGTYEHNAAKIGRVHEGDVVLFTGQNEVWAIGVVGYRFENASLAAAMWTNHPDKGTYRHIYAVTQLERLSVPYAVVNRALGLKETNHFQSMAVYDEERAQAVIDVLHLEVPAAHGEDYAAKDQALAKVLEGDKKSTSPFLAIEKVHATSTSYTVSPGERVVLRGEGTLVQAYAATLPSEVAVGRQPTPAGMPDLCVDHGSHTELIEAKSSADRAYVRQALAQILHYGPELEPTPALAGALFPARPAQPDIAYLHRYGIDCIYRAGADRYVRLPASKKARARLLDQWN
jgi:hypothetical protein